MNKTLRLIPVLWLLLLCSGDLLAGNSQTWSNFVYQSPSWMIFPLRPTPTQGALWASRGDLLRDLGRGNLVAAAEQRIRKLVGAAGAIQLTGTDFALFAQPGNSQLIYQASTESVTFNMVIGQADALNAQTWTLPAGLTNELDVSQRRDFVLPSTIPASLRLPGVTHASKYVSGNRLFISYLQYQFKAAEIQLLGYAVDRKVGLDYETESPDVGSSFAVVPLGLGASYTDKQVIDAPDDALQTTIDNVVTFDGFGTLNTPNGSFQALRYTMVVTEKEFDVTDPNDPVEIDTFSSTKVGWVTKQGTWIVADYEEYNPTTGAATLRNVFYSSIVPTASLSPTFTNNCGCNR